jgi:hypothetical protein
LASSYGLLDSGDDVSPDVGKGQDPGLVLTFALPMVVSAIGLMIWARRRRHGGK